MHVLCSLSGIEFKCDFFPGYLSSRETHHPIFNVPQKKLLSYLSKWSARELTEVDSYLLFLALLHSSERIIFRTAAHAGENTPAIIANHMQELAQTVIKINTVSNPAVHFPSFAIGPDTADLRNVHFWIEAWKQAFKDFKDGYKSANESQRLIRREAALERLIKNPFRKPGVFASAIADWAVTAGKFPNFPTVVNGVSVPLSEYWRRIIHTLASGGGFFNIDRADLKELLGHCEDNVPVGSIYSHELFKLLRTTLQHQENFLGLGNIDLARMSHTPFKLLDDTASVEEANMRAMIDSAPIDEPKASQYPSKLEYLKARARYLMAKEYREIQQQDDPAPGNEPAEDDSTDDPNSGEL